MLKFSNHRFIIQMKLANLEVALQEEELQSALIVYLEIAARKSVLMALRTKNFLINSLRPGVNLQNASLAAKTFLNCRLRSISRDNIQRANHITANCVMKASSKFLIAWLIWRMPIQIHSNAWCVTFNFTCQLCILITCLLSIVWPWILHQIRVKMMWIFPLSSFDSNQKRTRKLKM